MFAQVIINGLASGSVYALTALGLVMIYKTSHVLNFAHGEKAMFTTYIAFTLLGLPAVPLWGVLLFTIIAAVLIGFSVEFLVIRLARARGATEGTFVLIMLGFFLSIQGVASWIWGTGIKRFPLIISDQPIELHGIVINIDALISLGITTFLMFSLYFFFQRTLPGLSMRAMAENLDGSLLMGIRVKRTFLAVWGIACILGATAGLLVVNITFLYPGMMLSILLKSLAGAVLGGFDSYPGAVIGCLLVGLLESLIGVYVSVELKMVFAFMLITIVLLIKPTGLFGSKEILKV